MNQEIKKNHIRIIEEDNWNTLINKLHIYKKYELVIII